MLEIGQGRRRWRRAARQAAVAVGGLIGGALVLGAGIGYYIADQVTKPIKPSPDDDHVMTPYETGIAFEDVVFPSERASHLIHGWWLPREETNRVIICCTGYRGSKSTLVGIAAALWRAGFNVLLFDYHGHGADRGTGRISLGYHEVNDFLAALDYVKRRLPDAQIGVIGFSMGASVAVMGTAIRPEVRALVADSPFTTHADVIAFNVHRQYHVPGGFFAQLADLFLPRLSGYRNGDVEPVRHIAAIAPRPLLLIHGTEDMTVPVEHAYRNFAAAGEPKELWVAKGASHCTTYFLDRPLYCERVATFFERAFDADELAPAPAQDAGRAFTADVETDERESA